MATEATKAWAEREAREAAFAKLIAKGKPPHGGLKGIIASGKAPGARVQNPADGCKPPQPTTKETDDG